MSGFTVKRPGKKSSNQPLKEIKTPPPKAGKIAKATWMKGFVHLTVDGTGLVSLWDYPWRTDSYLKLKLTKAQQKLIQKTMMKNGFTP